MTKRLLSHLILSLPLENRVTGILHTINDRLADAVYATVLRSSTEETGTWRR